MEVGDVIRLSRLQLEDEVIIAQINAKRARFSLSTDQLAELKKGGVSDRIIAFMIRTGANQLQPSCPPSPPSAEALAAKPAAGAAAKPAPKPAAAQPPAGGEADPVEVGGRVAAEPDLEQGTLVIENLDSREYSLQFDAVNRRIFFWSGVQAVGRSLLPANGSRAYRVAPGTYALRWVGELNVHSLRGEGGGHSRAVLTRTAEDGIEALNLATYRDGRRRGGGNLVILAERSPATTPEEPAPAAATVVEKHHHYYAPAPETATTYVVERPYYPRWRHYRHVRYDRHHRCRSYRHNRSYCAPTVGFAYGWKRGKSRYLIGLNSHGGIGFGYGRKVGRGKYWFGIGW
jgi:hypothetical protein